MARGIPGDEIAFIHDANTDIRKAKLFSDMQAGRVRILMGSTSKMGAGMNVQRRLVAAHHLDAPWRPSDLEQRNGRIIRQGNMLYERDPDNFKVSIYYYATKQTYDARMWQNIQVSSSPTKSIIYRIYKYLYSNSVSICPVEPSCILVHCRYNCRYNGCEVKICGYRTRKTAVHSAVPHSTKLCQGAPPC
jgi:hypothetical protein